MRNSAPNTSDRVVITGGSGLLGGALVARFSLDSATSVLAPTRAELDLRDAVAVRAWFKRHRPSGVIHAAGRIGGLQAHLAEPVDFLEDNLRMTLNVSAAAREAGVQRLMFIASSAMYPAAIESHISEDALLSGAPDLAHLPYAIAKIAGVVLADADRRQHKLNTVSVAPCALYGPVIAKDPATAQVIPALIHKFLDAVRRSVSTVELWGNGSARREFLHVRDAAAACHRVFYSSAIGGLINVGSGEDTTIAELASIIASATGFRGRIHWNDARPQGVRRRILDVSRLHSTGWRPTISLLDGISEAVSVARNG